MKKTAIMLLAAFTISAAIPAMAQMSKEEKDLCLLATKNCLNQADSLQQRIKRIQGELKKGKKVYSAEELKTLNQKLQEANDLLKKIEKDTR